MIKSWSPSRLDKWENCPARAKYEIVEKLCPACFKGVLEGKFKEPQICNKCGVEQEIPAPIARGTVLHTMCETYIKGNGKLPAELKYVERLIKNIRVEYRKGVVKIEEPLVFNSKWEPVSVYTKDAWLRTSLDVLTLEDDTAEVIDWKSGGIDKKTKEIKAQDKYADQLGVYACAVLSAYSRIKKVTCALVFLDAPKDNVVMVGGTAERKDLSKLQKKWTGRARGILSDTLYVPRPSFGCKWCPFTKAKGGPCAF